MAINVAGGEDVRMIETSGTTTGRSLSSSTAVVREARRLIGFERHYHCGSCGNERQSWARMRACPDCGETFVAAVIRRAAVT